MSSDYHQWHYDYVRIAWDSGFHFDDYKSRKTFEENNLAFVDIERIIKDRDIASVERHIQNILQYKLEAEELRVLDPSFVNLFRISQLAVEYLIYCKKYLDSTVTDIKTELEKTKTENEELKQELSKHESDSIRLKTRIKDLKTVLQYQNKSGPLSVQPHDGLSIFQCSVCKKTFVSAEYLKAHRLRRHEMNEPNPIPIITNETPYSENVNTTPVNALYKAETDRLQSEIKELKEKLNNTEKQFKNEEIRQEVQENGSEEYYKHVESLHEQFQLLKTQMESELKVLQAQKFDHDKYDEWMSKVISKIDGNNSNEKDVEEVTKEVEKNVPLTPEVTVIFKNSGMQTDFLDESKSEIELEFEKKSKSKTSTSNMIESQGTCLSSDLVKEHIVESVNTFDIIAVQQEVENKIQEKTKEDINKLGQQLTEKMSISLQKFESQMESFWIKLHEIETKKVKSPVAKKLPPPIKIEVLSNVSDTDSDTESNQVRNISAAITLATKENVQIQNHFVTELKQKIQQSNLQKASPKVKSDKKLNDNYMMNIIETVQPRPQQKAPQAKETSSESESESTIESKSSTEISESEIIPLNAKPSKTTDGGRSTNTAPTNHSVRSLEYALSTNPDLFKNFRSEMQDVVSNRLKDLGIDPEWKRLPNKAYMQKHEIVTHHRNLAAKRDKSFIIIREQLLKKLEEKLHGRKQSKLSLPPESNIKSSKFKSIFSNVKNKAKSMISADKSQNQTTGVYKLTVSDSANKPFKEQTVPPKLEIKNIKKLKMYEDVESSDTEQTKTILPKKKMMLKQKQKSVYKSDTSMDSEDAHPSKLIKPLKNIGKSLSSLDSLKKSFETLSDTNNQNEVSKLTKSTDDNNSSISQIFDYEHANKTSSKDKLGHSTPNSIEDLSEHSETIHVEHKHFTADENKNDYQKGVLKNYPSTSSLVKKKVIFDLESDNNKSTAQMNRIQEDKELATNKIKKTISKTETVTKDDSSDNISSLMSDIKQNSSPKRSKGAEKLNTKALINVSSKKIDDDISDWDISDIYNS